MYELRYVTGGVMYELIIIVGIKTELLNTSKAHPQHVCHYYYCCEIHRYYR
jgi:hypothetical protein